jgi:oligoribonuclease NrnB/cAMP/cGMP phosphodiesterase (DHH superfamily)
LRSDQFKNVDVSKIANLFGGGGHKLAAGFAVIGKLEKDEAARALGHRAGEWMFERHHSMFLRERIGPDLEFKG